MHELVYGFGFSLAVALLIPNFWDRQHSSSARDWYRKNVQNNIIIALPPILFAIVWIILYIFMVIAISIWSLRPVSEMKSGLYIATWVIIVFNILFNRLWTLFFFSFRDKSWSVLVSLIDAILIFLTSLIIVILFHLSSASHVAIYILWYPYVIWSLFAVLLNYTYYDHTKGNVL